MRTLLLLCFIFPVLARCHLAAADLPTVTIEHLYYLSSRGERIGRLKPDEMIDYCIAHKLGDRAFEDFYSQLFQMRVELTKLLRIDELPENDPRVMKVRKMHEEYLKLLREESQKVQRGIAREGQIANETLDVIARVQNPQR